MISESLLTYLKELLTSHGFPLIENSLTIMNQMVDLFKFQLFENDEAFLVSSSSLQFFEQHQRSTAR
jgi:hypothetical protein